MDADKKLNETKIKIADLIINLNECEKWMEIVIANYINSPQKHFIREVLLDNHIINFGNKIKIIEYIIIEKEIITHKKFISSLKTMANKRNAIAHSDSYLDDFSLFPIVAEVEPEVKTLNEGKLVSEKYEKIFEDFEVKYQLVLNELQQLNLKV